MKNLLVFFIVIASAIAFESQASAQLFGRREVNVNVNGANVNVRRAGLFGQRTNVNVNGFGVAAVNVNNGRNRGRNVNVNVATGFAPAFVPARFNTFGVAVVQDGFGNVFEVDAFGNSRFAGSSFNRGFQGTVFRGSSFSSVSVVPFSRCH